MENTTAELQRATGVLEELGDDVGLSQAWNLAGKLYLWLGRSAAAQDAFERSLAHARRAGNRRDEVETLIWLLLDLVLGATPAAQGVRRYEELWEEGRGERQLEAFLLIARGALAGMQGRPDEARTCIAHGREVLEDLGARLSWAGSGIPAGLTGLLIGEPREAEEALRPACELLEEIGETGYLSTAVGYLAQVLYEQGRYEEAERFTRRGEETAAPDDFESQIHWRSVRAKLMAQRGELRAAERLAREAVAIAEKTDFLNLHGSASMSLGEVLRIGGRADEAAKAIRRARDLYEQKENVVWAGRARALLGELAAQPLGERD